MTADEPEDSCLVRAGCLTRACVQQAAVSSSAGGAARALSHGTRRTRAPPAVRPGSSWVAHVQLSSGETLVLVAHVQNLRAQAAKFLRQALKGKSRASHRPILTSASPPAAAHSCGHSFSNAPPSRSSVARR